VSTAGRSADAGRAHASHASVLAPEAAWEAVVNSSYRRRDYVLRRTLAAADALGISAALFLAMLIADVRTDLSEALIVLPTLPAWLALFRAYGLYEQDVRKISHSALDDVPRLFHALVIGGLGLWVVYRLADVRQLTLPELLVFGTFGMLFPLTLRLAARRITTRIFGPERVLFLGDAPVVDLLVRKMRDHPEYALAPAGLVVRARDSAHWRPLPILGQLDEIDLGRLVKRQRIERVIVSPTEVDDEAMLDLLHDCRRLSVKVSILPRHVDAMGPSVVIDDVEGVTLLDLNPPVLARSSRTLKRAMDVAGASFMLLLTGPLMGLIAVAIKLDSRGPVLFKQARIGKGGRRFRLLKFRTMVPDAERHVDELLRASQDPDWLKLERDPRVTRVGRVLRLTSLDELPQLWNAIKGEMSLVGPRPLVEAEATRVTGWVRSRLDLAPGITGLWQVSGRTNIPFAEMTKLDYLYVTNWSLWLDIKLLLRTPPILVSRRGAN
jgi:exopolysaccharide biosynthesis polyprenyl glycosylphosphotransferase